MTIKLYNEDCLGGLRSKITSNSISTIITSPPFNCNIKYNKYKDNLPEQKYCSWLKEIFRECYMVLENKGSFFLNISSKPSAQELQFKVIEVGLEVGFKLQNTIIWVKSIYINNKTYGHIKPINSKLYLNQGWEFILHFTKDRETHIDRLGNGVPYTDKSNINRWKDKNDLRDRGNVWFIPYHTIQKKKYHPTTFPEELPDMCMRQHGLDKIHTVLDPFCGAGTTGMAAIKNNKNFIGFDIDKCYIEEAERNLAGILK